MRTWLNRHSRQFLAFSVLFAVMSCAWAYRPTFPADAFFRKNSVVFANEKSVSDIHKLVASISNRNLENIIIQGHADKSERNPILLSIQRAEATKRLFIEFGIPSERIYAEGKGAKQPVLTDADKNRRVEIEALALPVGGDIPQYKLTWRMVDSTVTGPRPPELKMHQKWLAKEYIFMPVIEFIQLIDEPRLKLWFAHKTLIEAIWRQDDDLTRAAFVERQIAHAIIDTRKPFVTATHIDSLPRAALEAATYGTDFAKQITQFELENLHKDHPSRKYLALHQLLCKEPRYVSISLRGVELAGRMLFPAERFASAFRPAEQQEVLSCTFEQGNGRFEWLLNQGANPDTPDVTGQTFLHKEILLNSGTSVISLLRNGANPNATDYRGNTPLHLVYNSTWTAGGLGLFSTFDATVQRKRSIWDTLIAAGANPNQPNKAGQLPIKP